MNKKKQSAKKMSDVSKPKKRAVANAPGAPKLDIPKRSIIVTAADDPQETDDSSTETEQVKTRREAKTIEPRADLVLPKDPEPAQKPKDKPNDTDSEANPKPQEAPKDTKPTDTNPKSQETSKSDKQEKPEPKTTPDKEEPDSETEKAAAEPQEPDDNTPAETKPHSQKQKPPEDAKREQEIQKHIENREYFVPINAVGRKRSLKISVALTLLELLLGILLINLMLDAGLIELLEKVPHTNFFNLH